MGSTSALLPVWELASELALGAVLRLAWSAAWKPRLAVLTMVALTMAALTTRRCLGRGS